MKFLVDTSICISYLDEDAGWQNIEERILNCRRGGDSDFRFERS